MEQALIVIDVQKDYFSGGRCELVNAYEAGLKVKELVESISFRQSVCGILWLHSFRS